MQRSETKPENGGTGNIFIISAPSGTGKTTLCKELRRCYPDMGYSVSYTTRPPRKGEKDGVDYHFVSIGEFTAGISSGRWAEWAEVHGNYYGTSADAIRAVLSRNRDILLDIDVQGARQIVEKFPDSITLFIMPPSTEVLKQRLRNRRTESREVIDRRLSDAEKEMQERHRYRHVIVNDDLAEAVSNLLKVVETYRRKKRP